MANYFGNVVYVAGYLGYQGVPVVVVGQGQENIYGVDPSLLKELLHGGFGS